MKKILICLSIGLSLLSCKSTDRKPAGSIEELQEQISDKYQDMNNRFIAAAEENLIFRQKALDFYKKNEKRFAMKVPDFSSAEMELIHKGLSVHLRNRETLLHDFVAPATDPKAKTLIENFESYDHQLNYTQGPSGQRIVKIGNKSIHHIQYNPNDINTRELFLRLKYAVAAGLLIYDNYMVVVSPYADHPKLNYLLNADFKPRRDIFSAYNLCKENSDFFTEMNKATELRKDVLNLITAEFFDNCRRAVMVKVLRIIMSEWELRNKHKDIMISKEEAYLDALINSSPFFQMARNGKAIVGLAQTLDIKLGQIKTKYNWYKRGASYYLSMGFGNGAGLYQARPGKMKSFSENRLKDIARRLKPMDILQEKTPFRLTDKFIPGYYGHAAIWVGTEAELKALMYRDPRTGEVDSVWNLIGLDIKTGKHNPNLRAKYHEMIRSGHHIIEALRPGVVINTLKHFMDIDDFLAIRDNSLTDQERAHYALIAFEQVGKEYDFNFDVLTKDRIVCSEIVYQVYQGYEWPLDKALGRWTISPDHVAWEADGGCFEPVVMFVDGQEVKSDLKGKLASLINGPEGIKGEDGTQPMQRRTSCKRQCQDSNITSGVCTQ